MKRLPLSALFIVTVLGFQIPSWADSSKKNTQEPGQAAHHEMTESMQKMKEKMDSMPMSGNPDQDFAKMMIEHHRGALDMAKAELEHGRDPALKKMAQKMINQQKKEISELETYVAKGKLSTS